MKDNKKTKEQDQLPTETKTPETQQGNEVQKKDSVTDKPDAEKIVEKAPGQGKEGNVSAEKTQEKKKNSTAKKAPSKKSVVILVSNLAGKYGLNYNRGDKISIEIKQAQELIDAGDAKEA